MSDVYDASKLIKALSEAKTTEKLPSSIKIPVPSVNTDKDAVTFTSDMVRLAHWATMVVATPAQFLAIAKSALTGVNIRSRTHVCCFGSQLGKTVGFYDIIDLQDFAGHADPRTTLSYIRTRDRLSKSPAYVLKY